MYALFGTYSFTFHPDPLYRTLTHPDVTFYGKPQECEFSTGGHTDFNNGVEVTLPSNTVRPGSTVRVKVQPSFAPSDVFVMPEGIQSASPSYLISCDGLAGEVTVTIEYHVRVPTRDLVFLQADPASSNVYKYREVGRSVFMPNERKGRLTTGQWSAKFLKIGVKFIKTWFGCE